VRVVIAEDSVLLRQGLTRLLRDAGVEVVAEVGDATVAVAAVRSHRPDVAVLDIRMPPLGRDDGIRAAEEIRQTNPEIGILLLSAHLHPAPALRLVERHPTGGLGYLLKDHVVSLEVMIDALQRIGAGETVLDPDIVAALLGRGGARGRLQELTPREQEVLALMGEGRSNAAISRRMQLSPRTTETHVASIFTKLNLHVEEDDHRRVRAVLAYLDMQQTGG
jgi:DNA-binding NarL/FixJ family response regulator